MRHEVKAFATACGLAVIRAQHSVSRMFHKVGCSRHHSLHSTDVLTDANKTSTKDRLTECSASDVGQQCGGEQQSLYVIH